MRGGEGLDAGPGQGGQQRGAAGGRLPWPAGGGGLVEPGADVAFEPAELVAERGGADAQAGGCGGDGGGGHGGLEPAQPEPAGRAVLGRAADIAGLSSPGSAEPPVPAGPVRAWPGRGGAELAGHGDAVLAGDPGEEPAGDPGVGFQLPEVLARGDVLAVEELAGQDGAGMLPPLPCQGRGGPAPLPRGPGDAVQREPDVAGGGAQPRGGLGDGELPGDDEVAGGVQVDVVRFGPGQVQAGAAAGRRGPGQRLADAQVVQERGGVVVQRVPQPGGQGPGEGLVAAVVVVAGEREGVPGVVQVGAGEQLEQVALGVAVPAGFAGVRGGAVAQVAPLPGGDRLGGDQVAAALVVDGAAAGVEVAGQAADRGEHGVVAAAGQRPQHRADGQGAAVGVQRGDGRAGSTARLAGQQQARGDGAAERAGREPAGGHQPDRPVRP